MANAMNFQAGVTKPLVNGKHCHSNVLVASINFGSRQAHFNNKRGKQNMDTEQLDTLHLLAPLTWNKPWTNTIMRLLISAWAFILLISHASWPSFVLGGLLSCDSS